MDQKRLQRECGAFLDETMNLNDLPGLAIGVSAGGAAGGVSAGGAADRDAAAACAGSAGGVAAFDGTPVEFAGARGYRDYAARVPLEADDIFHCASVSKLFTSSAVMKLVGAGVLDLGDRLCDLLPELRIADRRFEEIRLWNLLTHTSGLGDVDYYRWYDHETDGASLRRYVYGAEEVLAQPMLWAPQVKPCGAEPQDDPAPQTCGTAREESRFRYSNIAYEILGQIVAEYAARMPGADGPLSYEDFVSRYLFEPAGMKASTMKTFERPGFPDFAEDGPMARPHEKKPDRSIGLVKDYPYTRQHAPSSTLTSNVCDLLRWGRACLDAAREGRLSPQAWQPYAIVPNNGEQMGLGWFMREQKVASDDGAGRVFQLYGHEGTDDGFRASFWICPELDLVTVVLSNLSGAPVKRINKKLFDRIVRSGVVF